MGFTRNYDNLVTAYQSIMVDYSNVSSEAGTGDGYLTLTNWGGAANTLISPSYVYMAQPLLHFKNLDNESIGSYDSYRGTDTNLVCGPGTYDSDGNLKPEDYEDNIMTLFNNSQITKVKHWKEQIQYDESADAWTNIYHKVYTANTTITIREIGIRCYPAGGCLLYRKVLDTPITITVENGLTQNFEITFTQTVKAGLNKAYYDTKIETYEDGEVDWS